MMDGVLYRFAKGYVLRWLWFWIGLFVCCVFDVSCWFVFGLSCGFMVVIRFFVSFGAGWWCYGVYLGFVYVLGGLCCLVVFLFWLFVVLELTLCWCLLGFCLIEFVRNSVAMILLCDIVTVWLVC